MTPEDLLLLRSLRIVQASWHIHAAIDRLNAAGWTHEAQSLADDCDRAESLPDLLMVRDDAERLVEQLMTEQA